MATVVYDVEKLKRLWNQGRTHAQIASALGCPVVYVAQLRARHKLPKRRTKYTPPVLDDLTEEEIIFRAAEIRRQNLETLRRSNPKPSSDVGAIRCVGWDGYRFHGFA